MKIECREPVEILYKVIELKAPKQVRDLEDHLYANHSEDFASITKPNGKLLNKNIRHFISHPLFTRYSLSQGDVMVIADLWHYHLEYIGSSRNWTSICSSAKIKPYKVTECLEYLISLLERKIICFDEKVSSNYYLNPTILQAAEYTLSKDIVMRILGRDLRSELDLVLKEKWQRNEDFISDLKLVFGLCYNSFGELSSRSPVLEYPIVSVCLNLLYKRILSAPTTLGIKTLIRQYDLSEDQLYIILVVLYHQLFGNDRITEDDLAQTLAPDPRNRLLLQRLLNEDSVLISSGLIGREKRFQQARVSSMGIPLETMKTLVYKANVHDDIAKTQSPFFHKCQPTQTLDDVIIPASEKQLIVQMISRCKLNRHRDLQKWGFRIENSKQGVVMLLYGASGTGKTYTAGAIAKELHKELITLNVPELRNMYYGETEKLIQKAFTEMREMATKKEDAPVFLLNEADQLIHERIANTSTCSSIENSIQSIILEELETFPGILILTTNLESNMDEAFFRRFDLKFRFKLPELDSRRKLWNVHLRMEIPRSIDIDLELLAQKYQFSGAQIALVVQNACVEAIGRRGKSRRLCLNDLLKYADLEQAWSCKTSKSIGF